jgi:hypothetical protein
MQVPRHNDPPGGQDQGDRLPGDHGHGLGPQLPGLSAHGRLLQDGEQ